MDQLGQTLPDTRLLRPRQSIATTILAAIEHCMSKGLIESTNTKIRVITRMAYGFPAPDHLIALAMLNLSGHCPPLPGRK